MQHLIFEILITKIYIKHFVKSQPNAYHNSLFIHLFALNICYLTPNIYKDEMFKSLGEICIQF